MHQGGTLSAEGRTNRPDLPPFRLASDEQVILGMRRTSWAATFLKIVTLGLYIPWWKAAGFAITDQRIIARQGILNKEEIALPLRFVQDASGTSLLAGYRQRRRLDCRRSRGKSSYRTPQDRGCRRFAQTIIAQAKLVGGAGASRASNDAITADLVRLLQRGGVI